VAVNCEVFVIQMQKPSCASYGASCASSHPSRPDATFNIFNIYKYLNMLKTQTLLYF